MTRLKAPAANHAGKQLVRRLVEEGVNARDLSVPDELADGPVAETARRWIDPLRAALPDFHMEIVDLIAEGDRVAAQFRCSGTQLGEWLGQAPTGRRFEGVDEIYVFTIRTVSQRRIASARSISAPNSGSPNPRRLGKHSLFLVVPDGGGVEARSAAQLSDRECRLLHLRLLTLTRVQGEP